MRRLSVWARCHRRQARFLMIIAWITLIMLTIFFGNSLNKRHIQLSTGVFTGSTVIFLLAVLLYTFRPQRNRINASLFYRWPKSCDFLLALSSFGLMLYAANQPGTLFQRYGSLYAAVVSPVSMPKDSSAKKYLPVKEFSEKMYTADGKMLKWKERKKLLKQQIKAIRQASEPSKADKTLLIILSVLAALGLLLLVTSLACNLSCNWHNAAAVLVGAAGTGLVIFLFILAIRAINGKNKKKKLQQNKTPGP